ncbi:hypothetical protein OPQ81_011640 [Rhizoctonia solani]|nr:hypothetical protein OPQ81_011640 [Rhizoctonia solani]
MSIDAAPRPFRGPWEGDTKIVIGIDIGTTQSGVAFAFLQNGASQVIHRVTRWPGQEAHNQQGKIPTIVWYDSSKKAVSFGAEAQLFTTEEKAEDNGWVLARYFKLHLHPSDMQARHELKLDDLPPGVTLRQIYSDFLGYLLKHTRAFFEDRILDGKQIWERYSPTMEVVIAHPNGWGIREQAFLRSAAVSAGFATADLAPAKVRFVTEAEASVHFCIHHTNLGNVLQPGTNFAVCDAGGSTVDTTLYSVKSARPILKLEEKRASACVQAGAIFVDFEAEKFFRRTLASAGLSREDVADYTKTGVKDFENFAKRAFHDEAAEQSVAVAHTRFNNTAIRARRGRLTLSGSKIKEFFDMGSAYRTFSWLGDLVIVPIFEANSRNDMSHEVRGLHSPMIQRQKLSPMVQSSGVLLAVFILVLHDTRLEPLLLPRSSLVFTADSGRTSYMNAKGEPVVSWCMVSDSPKGSGLGLRSGMPKIIHSTLYDCESPDLELFTVELLAFLGEYTPEWAYDPHNDLCPGFRDSCTIRANLRNLEGALTSGTGRHGSRYWSLDFDICIRFGGTELESYIEWEERGIKRKGPVAIISQEIDL